MECPICLETVEENNNITITKCNHTFHTDCLCTSISFNNQSCPICRKSLVFPSKEDPAVLSLTRLFIHLSSRRTHVIHITDNEE